MVDSSPPTARPEDPWYVRGARTAANVARAVGLGKIVTTVRNHARINLCADVHKGITEVLNLALARDIIDANEDVNRTTLLSLCSVLRNVMAGVNGSTRESLHCTIKLHVPREAPEEGTIMTIGRSDGKNERWAGEFGQESRYKVTDNSAFSALLGLNDGNVPWRAPFECFSCNSLRDARLYVNKRRKAYGDYYDSTVVFPVSKALGDEEHRLLAFLTFDTLCANGFPGMPDIYQLRAHENNDRKALYHQQLFSSCFYRVGSVLANVLGIVLPGHRGLVKEAVE